MMNLNRKIIYIAFALLFIICMLLANPISAKIYNRQYQISVVKSPDEFLKDEVIFTLDTARAYSDAFETVKIKGVACCPAEYTENREVYVQLRNDKVCYQVPAKTSGKNARSFKADDEVYNKDFYGRFYSEFSSFEIANGEYELYLVVKENPTTYGTIKAGRHFTKTSQGIVEG